MVVGILTLYFGNTQEIIKLSVFGALTLYILSMVSFLRLRKKEPSLERPFRAPLVPFAPWAALLIAAISIIAMTVYNLNLALLYGAVLLASFLLYKQSPKSSIQK
jgi:ethanolamine permease